VSVKKLINVTPFVVLLLVVSIPAVMSAQTSGQSPAPAPGMTPDVPHPNPTGSDPKPEDAANAILASFDRYEVVGMSAAHGDQDLDNFTLGLIRNPAFPSKVDDIAVECGNSLYQPILDRYIAGDEVPLSEVRQVWRNTTQAMCGLSGFYEELFPLVRRLNQKLPPEKKLRVLAGDPPLDWSKVQSRGDLRGKGERDANIASVMEKEVLSKHRKALMLFGTFHLLHSGNTAFPSAVELYEKNYPGVTLVIAEHEGFGNWTPLAKYNDEFEAKMTSWTIPSLVQQMKGTWLADLLDMTYSPGAFHMKLIQGPSGTQAQIVPIVLKGYSKMVDAYLYLGPRDLQLSEPRPAEISLDKDYMTELQRRATIMQDDLDKTNKERLLKGDYSPFLYDPDYLQRAIQDFCQSHPATPCVILEKIDVKDP